MDVFLEYFFEVSRARWWQVLAATVAGAAFTASAAWEMQPGVAHAVPYAIGGGIIGLLAAVFLLWIDAARRTRQARGEARLTLRERFMLACLIFGFAIAALSLLSCAFMGIIQAIQWVNRL